MDQFRNSKYVQKRSSARSQDDHRHSARIHYGIWSIIRLSCFLYHWQGYQEAVVSFKTPASVNTAMSLRYNTVRILLDKTEKPKPMHQGEKKIMVIPVNIHYQCSWLYPSAKTSANTSSNIWINLYNFIMSSISANVSLEKRRYFSTFKIPKFIDSQQLNSESSVDAGKPSNWNLLHVVDCYCSKCQYEQRFLMKRLVVGVLSSNYSLRAAISIMTIFYSISSMERGHN